MKPRKTDDNPCRCIVRHVRPGIERLNAKRRLFELVERIEDPDLRGEINLLLLQLEPCTSRSA